MTITRSAFNTFKRVLRRDNSYEPVLPYATYAPWLTDEAFLSTFRVIKPYTMVDRYRCYELWQLVEQVSNFRGALIEVGVWRGGSGALIAKQCQLRGIKDLVYLCDTFTGVVKRGAVDVAYAGGEHADTTRETVQQLLDKLGLDNTRVVSGIFPEESGKLVHDESFRLCHIDVDVYQSAKDVVRWIWPRLVVGGVVVFDDYGFRTCPGITQFVNEERGKAGQLVIHNLNGHAILVKTSN